MADAVITEKKKKKTNELNCNKGEATNLVQYHKTWKKKKKFPNTEGNENHHKFEWLHSTTMEQNEHRTSLAEDDGCHKYFKKTILLGTLLKFHLKETRVFIWFTDRTVQQQNMPNTAVQYLST